MGDTIKPRLMEAGADLNRILSILEEKNPLSLLDERIEKAIVENNARLLILDPIQGYLGSHVDINRANEIRSVLKSISAVAERTGCAIVLIGHLNKASSSSSAYRGLGSIEKKKLTTRMKFTTKLKLTKKKKFTLKRKLMQKKTSIQKMKLTKKKKFTAKRKLMQKKTSTQRRTFIQRMKFILKKKLITKKKLTVKLK